MQYTKILLIAFYICYSYAHPMYQEPFLFQKSVKSWLELRDVNLTRQKYDYSCGAASLSSILSYFYGIETSELEILEFLLQSKSIDVNQKHEIETNHNLREKVHISFLDLAAFTHHKGFRAQGLALDIQTLGKLQIPVIIYVNIRDREHFSVYKGMDSHYVYLADPSLGNIKVSKAKFIEMFYQRKDLSYPGKILAIISDTHKGNKDFLIHKTNTMIYEIMKYHILK